MRILYIKIIFVLFCGSVYSQNPWFKKWDRDGNLEISKDEFIFVFNKSYERDFSDNDNKWLDDEDLYKITFVYLDLDDNRLLSDEEWENGFDHLLPGFDINKYSVYDSDDNSMFDFNEFIVVMNKINYLPDRDINGDGVLHTDEIAQDVFNKWDENNNRLMNEDEFNNFYKYYRRIK